MKRFLLNIFVFAGVVGLLAVVVVCFILPRIPLYTAPFNGWKQRCLSVHQPSDKPRLILVGGSNLACGIDTAMLSRELGERYNVINLGFHAGLGVGIHLDMIDAGLKSGDFVVLCVEYHNWSRWNGELPATVFRCDVEGRNHFTSMLGSKWCTVDLRQWRHYVLEKWRKVSGGGQLFSEATHDADWALRGAAPNEPTNDDHPDPRYAARPVRMTGQFNLDELSSLMLQRLSLSYKERGVWLLLSAPSYDARLYEQHSTEINKIYSQIVSRLGIKQISNPAGYAFPLSQMANTEWHVNRIGREKMTRSLAHDLIQSSEIAL